MLKDDPRSPAQIKLHYDHVVGEANHATEPETDDSDPSYLPIILFAVLTLAGVLAVLAFIVASKLG